MTKGPLTLVNDHFITIVWYITDDLLPLLLGISTDDTVFDLFEIVEPFGTFAYRLHLVNPFDIVLQPL